MVSKDQEVHLWWSSLIFLNDSDLPLSLSDSNKVKLLGIESNLALRAKSPAWHRSNLSTASIKVEC
jgi:hypothetical protein